MRLTQRQAEAINKIIQDEVQDVLKGRSSVSEHMQRAELFEAVAGDELEQARSKVEEASFLLAEARDLLYSAHPDMAGVASDAAETAYELMGRLDAKISPPEDYYQDAGRKA